MRTVNQDELTMNYVSKILKENETGTTVGIFGPSGNAKSTGIATILNVLSNKALAQNIGDVSQTSLFATMVSLNTRLRPDQAIIKCVEKTHSTDFQDSVLNFTKSTLYHNRDDLDEFKITSDMLKGILNPANKSFHIHEYCQQKRLDLKQFIEILNALFEDIINQEIGLIDEVDKVFKEKKIGNKKPKKQDIFEDIVIQRFYKSAGFLENIQKWYSEIEENIMQDVASMCEDVDALISHGSLAQEGKVTKLLEYAYNPQSAFSLVFSELIFVACPNDNFIRQYEELYKVKVETVTPLIINIRDTIGVTQTSEDANSIADSIEIILQNNMDAALFLCSADEKASVYQYCMESMNTKENKKILNSIPFTICKTKADTIIRNKSVNLYRKDTGESIIPTEKIKEYIEQAFAMFKQDFLTKYLFSEEKIGFNHDNKNSAIEYVSLAPDLYEQIVLINPEFCTEMHFRNIVLNLAYAVDKKYVESNMKRIHPINKDNSAINAMIKQSDMDRFANYMVLKNASENKQYLQYLSGSYHGNSINTFIRKHRCGIGHETNARVYDDFKLFVKNMVRKWINSFQGSQPLSIFALDFENVFVVEDRDKQVLVDKFNEVFMQILTHEIERISDRISKKLSYDCFETDFWNCYEWKTRQNGFVDNLQLFNKLFGDTNYWEKNMITLYQGELQTIVDKISK